MSDKLTLQKQTNDYHKNGTHTWYEVAFANSAAYNTNTFRSIKEAEQCIKDEYRERNKQDGHDDYWRKLPLVILKVTETKEVVRLDDPS